MSKTYTRPLMKDLTPAEYTAKFGMPTDFGMLTQEEIRSGLSASYNCKDGRVTSSVRFKGQRPNLRFGRSQAITHAKTPGPYEGKRGITIWGLWMRLNDPREIENAKIWNEVLRMKIPLQFRDATGAVPSLYKDMFYVTSEGAMMSAQWETSDLDRKATVAEVAAGCDTYVSLVTEYDLLRHPDGTPVLDAKGRGRHVSKAAKKEDVRECTRGKIVINIAPWHNVEKGCGWSAYAYEVGIKSTPPAAMSAAVDDDPEVLATFEAARAVAAVAAAALAAANAAAATATTTNTAATTTASGTTSTTTTVPAVSATVTATEDLTTVVTESETTERITDTRVTSNTDWDEEDLPATQCTTDCAAQDEHDYAALTHASAPNPALKREHSSAFPVEELTRKVPRGASHVKVRKVTMGTTG